MAWFNVYGSLRQVIQDLVAPGLEAILGKIEAMNGRFDGQDMKIDALDTKIESVRISLDARIESVRISLDAKIESLRGEVHGIRDDVQDLRLEVRQKWEQSLEIHERLAAVEAKLEIR